MSLSWRDRLDVLLLPDGIEVFSRKAFRRGGRASRYDCAPARTGSGPGGEEWRAPVAALSALPARSCDLSVLLSSRFVRFQTLPWLEEVGNAEEKKAHAAIRFRQVFGPAADAWELAVSEDRPGKGFLASAVDRALLDALRAVAVEKGMRLKSVRPAFVLAWNRWRRMAPADSLAFALAEPAGFCMAGAEAGGWIAVRTRRLEGEALATELAAAREEMALLAGMKEGTCLLAGVSAKAAAPGWRSLEGSWRDWL